jgi:colanic acid/amylovoran biosynthesis glycosyltransferase
MPSKVAYFINQYPKISHAFIRREILALERHGLNIQRIALRGWDAEIIDAEDREEQRRTQYVLQDGLGPLFTAMLKLLIADPGHFLSALALAIRIGWRAHRPLRYHLVCFAEACRTLPWLKALGARHVHAHFGTNAAEIVMLVRVLGGPSYSFTVHGPEEFDKPEFLHIREKVRHSAFVVAITSFARSQLYRWVEYAQWPKIKVIHCGIEAAFHENASFPLTGEIPRLVSVGRLSAEKGQLLLVDAAHALARKGIEFELVLVGDGEMRGEIEALIAKYSLQGKVRLTGSISTERLREEMLRARGLVLPSFAEGLPMVIMEAMALRRPVLTTFVAGIPELVIPGKTGWLFPAGSVDALTDALEDFLSRSADELRIMGDAAYLRVLERHAIDVEVKQLADLFRQASSDGAHA